MCQKKLYDAAPNPPPKKEVDYKQAFKLMILVSGILVVALVYLMIRFVPGASYEEGYNTCADKCADQVNGVIEQCKGTPGDIMRTNFSFDNNTGNLLVVS